MTLSGNRRSSRIQPPMKSPARLASAKLPGFLLLTVVFVGIITGCSGARVQPPPASIPAPSILSSESGKASFFFPVAIPLSQVRRIVEESVPPRMSDERKQEISGAIQDDFYRYTLERGEVEVGFSGEWLTFSFPVRGRLTIGGRLGGLPVQETIELGGPVRGTASPAITPDWRPDPRPAAQIELDRADLKLPGGFSVGVRSLLEARLNPILNQELQKAAGRLLADLALRRKAEEAWRSLHVARRAVAGRTSGSGSSRSRSPSPGSLRRTAAPYRDRDLGPALGSPGSDPGRGHDAAAGDASAAAPDRRGEGRRLRAGGAVRGLARGAVAVDRPGAPWNALPDPPRPGDGDHRRRPRGRSGPADPFTGLPERGARLPG